MKVIYDVSNKCYSVGFLYLLLVVMDMLEVEHLFFEHTFYQSIVPLTNLLKEMANYCQLLLILTVVTYTLLYHYIQFFILGHL